MKARSGVRSHILFVEDDPDIRETLAELLRDEGHEVVEAESAEDGLSALRAARFDVVLSDYNLPGQSGTSMIEQARAEGRLAQTVPLLLSASTQIDGAEGIRLLRKPIDVDDLCREIAAAQAQAEALDPAETAIEEAAARSAIALMLFVHGRSPSAARSRSTLEKVLDDHGLPASTLQVVDVSTEEGVAVAEREHVAFTPTLMRVSPLPRRWIVGDLRQRAPLVRLLRDSGAERA